ELREAPFTGLQTVRYAPVTRPARAGLHRSAASPVNGAKDTGPLHADAKRSKEGQGGKSRGAGRPAPRGRGRYREGFGPTGTRGRASGLMPPDPLPTTTRPFMGGWNSQW